MEWCGSVIMAVADCVVCVYVCRVCVNNVCLREKPAGQQQPRVPGWLLDAQHLVRPDTSVQSSPLTTQWVSDAGLFEAKLEASGPSSYYYRQHHHDAWPDCTGRCLEGRCTISVQGPGCCWAGPPRDDEQQYAHQAAASHRRDHGADNLATNGVSTSHARLDQQFYRDPLEDQLWLCWS